MDDDDPPAIDLRLERLANRIPGVPRHRSTARAGGAAGNVRDQSLVVQQHSRSQFVGRDQVGGKHRGLGPACGEEGKDHYQKGAFNLKDEQWRLVPDIETIDMLLMIRSITARQQWFLSLVDGDRRPRFSVPSLMKACNSINRLR